MEGLSSSRRVFELFLLEIFKEFLNCFSWMKVKIEFFRLIFSERKVDMGESFFLISDGFLDFSFSEDKNSLCCRKFYLREVFRSNSKKKLKKIKK